MNISFKGIRNIQVARNRHNRRVIGLYPAIDGRVKTGEMDIKEYKMHMELTNDFLGKHFSKFLMAMTKAEKRYNDRFFINNPNKIELLMTQRNVIDDDIFDNYSLSTFKLNGESINITGRKTLALYTYLAKITRELINKYNLSENQKSIVTEINQAIHCEAERFIDYVL